MNAQEYQTALESRHKHVGRERRHEATCTCGWRASGETFGERRQQLHEHLHNPPMTRRQIEARIRKMLDDYAYSDTWPAGYQDEYERLCAMLHPPKAAATK